MIRKALIIGNPGENGASNYCKGVDKDIENYRRFLTSPLGGTWYPGEIAILRRPSTQEAHSAIHALKTAHYSFAAFCGHGHTDVKTRALIMELRTEQYLTESDMRKGAPRHSALFDCCRQIAASVLTEQRLMKALAARQAQSASASRAAFDAAVQRSPAGLIAAFACAMGETAGDDEQSGGYYSSSLFLAAENWSESGHGLLNLVDAHSRAERLVQTKSGNRQNPKIEKPRSEPYFPFAIMA